LEFYNLSYEQVPIKENSVIYCDPPYAGTAEYDGGFDHKKFLDWCHEQKNPVFISEYEINDDRFSQVLQIKKRSMLSSNKKMKVKLERVYVNKAGLYKTK
jgi:DNA adenine methylase